MLQPIAITGIGGILLFMIGLISLILLVIIFSDSRTHKELETEAMNDVTSAKRASVKLKNLSTRAEKMRKKLHGIEKKEVLTEMSRISKLWRSRRERLRGGIWETIATESQELKDLKKKEAEVSNLIGRAKVKYHKRELDEKSFREIVSGYQKELMELNLKIRELERA